VYLTSGSKEPYQDNNLSSFANSVERESRMVAKSLMMEVEFWRYPSGGLKIDRETIERLKDTIARINPEVIFMPFIADDNDDHRRSVQLFYEAFKSNKKLGFEIWAYQVYSTIIPNVIIDITEEIDEKIKLVDIWASQKARRNWAHYIKGLNAFNSRFLKTNEARYVETFFVVNGDEYMKLIANYFKSPPKDIYYTEFYRKEINNRAC
jgi:LmbE family N-acetylglucosaminyl deacetylase